MAFLTMEVSGDTRVHARSFATRFLLQISLLWALEMRRETSRVSFLMCPFCVRALVPSRTTPVPLPAVQFRLSDADPVTTAAPDFATATRRLAAKATRTVVRLAEPAPRAARESGPRNGFDLTSAPPLEGRIIPQASLAKLRAASAASRLGADIP
jgi:hypothetical protein